MNFNFSRQPEYNLNSSLIHEVIDLYGIKCKFLITEKVNFDKNVFGDFSHMKTDKNKIFDISVLPETSENFDALSYNFSELGFVNSDTTMVFVSAKVLDPIIDMKDIISNLIVLPSNKIMEVTNVEYMVPGINNLFTNIDSKSVYKLTLVPYDFKIIDEVQDKHTINDLVVKDNDAEIIGQVKTSLYETYETKSIPSAPYDELEEKEKENYKALNDYISKLVNTKIKQDLEAEVIPSVDVAVEQEKIDIKEKRPIYDNSEPDIFNGY